MVQQTAEAIFVVGLSRSGTTLMRRVLDSHSRIGIAGENHFVGHLLPREAVRNVIRRAGDLRDDAAVRRVVEMVYGGRIRPPLSLRPQSPHWDWLLKRVPREDFEARLLAGERSERGVFTAMMRVYADRAGKEIMGEKTPAHLNWTDTLLAWYPGGRVIHMLRDPRGVYASELRRRMGKPGGAPYRWLVHVPPLLRLFLVVQVGLTWNGAVRRHRTLRGRYPDGYRLVRFEDLVREPELTVAAVCEFLGVDVEPAMLVQKVVSRGARLGEAGFDANAADRWRTEIGPAAAGWIARIAGRRLTEMGYPAA
jgi:hypothetical protein